jgi:hypothetical protein
MGQAATGIRNGPARLELTPPTEKLSISKRLTLAGEWQKFSKKALQPRD